jgi:hypothetical protein
VAVCACDAAARTRKGEARAREIRGIGRPVDEDGNYISRYSASSDCPESQIERKLVAGERSPTFVAFP